MNRASASNNCLTKGSDPMVENVWYIHESHSRTKFWTDRSPMLRGYFCTPMEVDLTDLQKLSYEDRYMILEWIGLAHDGKGLTDIRLDTRTIMYYNKHRLSDDVVEAHGIRGVFKFAKITVHSLESRLGDISLKVARPIRLNARFTMWHNGSIYMQEKSGNIFWLEPVKNICY